MHVDVIYNYIYNIYIYIYIYNIYTGLFRGNSLAFCLTSFQNMRSNTKLTAKDATDAKKLANSTSRRPESNGRRHGPGFGPKPRKTKFNFILLTRAIPGYTNYQNTLLRAMRFFAWLSSPSIKDKSGRCASELGDAAFRALVQQIWGSTCVVNSIAHSLVSSGEKYRRFVTYYVRTCHKSEREREVCIYVYVQVVHKTGETFPTLEQTNTSVVRQLMPLCSQGL